MPTIRMQRHQTIERLTSQHPDMEVDSLIVLWVQLAAQITLIVGEGGFDSLYARSVFLSQSQPPFHGLMANAPTARSDQRFAHLKASLQSQPLAIAIEGNRFLLVTFTDILASLIGEPLTASILESAWGSRSKIAADEEKKQ